MRHTLVALAAAWLVTSPALADDVPLHVTGTSGTLAQATPSGWVGVCTTPCDVRVDRNARYRFVAPRGTDVNGSDDFQLPPDGTRVDVNVRAGLRSEYRIGVAILAIGGVILATGIGFVVGGYVVNQQNPGSKDGDPYQIGGVIGIILGTVGVSLGVVHMLNHRVSWIVMTPSDNAPAIPTPRAFTSQLLSFEF